MIRFLHAADLHLGMRITRFEPDVCNRIVEARFAALENLRKVAKQRDVQFILIAGDIFDDLQVEKSVASRAFAMLEGSANSCPVYLIPGNHDPLVPGGVWDRDPWLREQPHLRVHLLREAKPERVPDLPVVIFPCPLTQRRSTENPTAWIRNHPRMDRSVIRIGLAHGSLQVLPNLPLDDHLIPADAADQLDLDYLALGHWHRRHTYRARDGAERTAYSGTHEAMRFPGDDDALGWSSYSPDGDADRFASDGFGSALLVTIDAPRALLQIEPVETGWLRWTAETLDITGARPGEIINRYASRDDTLRTILRLRLEGVTTPREALRLEELRQVITGRYHPGSVLDDSRLRVQPSEEQLREVVGEGILRRVLDRLNGEIALGDAGTQHVAQHALRWLYRLAWEEQPL
ncbi:MAG: DNA repair exonuclease [Gemmatales bacterium]|nr:DNA repair exonuclease [Gemmatales bacterium]MDW8174642.1 DNA repair exonuclease [Gemmatales bacterium]